ncbi:hypothetical protein V1522DRAFT_416750 [Lipomyces starkeyi]
MVDKVEIHWFYDIGYRHQDYMHCPEPLAEFHYSGKCFCNPDQNVDGKSYSCTKEYRRMRGDPGGQWLISAKVYHPILDRIGNRLTNENLELMLAKQG